MTVWVVTLNNQIRGVYATPTEAYDAMAAHRAAHAQEAWRPTGTHGWASDNTTGLWAKPWTVQGARASGEPLGSTDALIHACAP